MTHPLLRRVAAVSLAALLAHVASAADENPWTAAPDPAAAPVPQWIWAKNAAKDNESENFRVTFDAKVPATKMTEDPSSALLWVAGDDEVTVHLNGKPVAKASRRTGSGATLADVRAELVHGTNVLTVTCRNNQGPAGVAVKLVVRGQYRSEPFTLVSDASWTVSDDAPKGWRSKNFAAADTFAPVRVIGPYGIEPWGKVDAEPPSNGATTVDHLTLLPGFKAELLYSVPKDTQGSWVSMAHDPKGRIYASDQGGPLYRVTPGKDAASTKVETVDLPIGHAQGLLWHNDSLYVVINGKSNNLDSGLYRLTDTNHDDKLDKIDKLLLFKGRTGEVAGGEHGPHAVLPGPDGKLYVVAGNFTALPDPILPTSPAAHWAEDALLPREPDGRGHDPNIWAPGGWVCRMDPDGSHVEAFTTGLRNSYDIAFNPDGELFTFDSDMEWDIGSPWYRPTRICHLVSGAEWGWRNGSAKWPTYYPDSAPPVVDIGLGSPTGVVFGTDAKFPAKYQHAFFANDWAYGKIFAVHLKPEGSSYTATFEPFVVGKPFDVTDIVVNTDGAMYVAIGGRSTQSGLYRITYTGAESTKPVPYPKDASAAKARALRHRLEAFHGVHDAGAVAYAWPFLNHPDRFIRFAARVAIESQPVAEWQDRALAPASPETAIQSLLALSRVGDKSLQPKILEALDRVEPASRDQKLELLRTYGVCFSRMGKPDTATLARYADRFDAGFPTRDRDLDHELAQLLVFCDSPTVVAKCIPFLASGDTQEEQLFYALTLRTMKAGWTRADRETYFKWLNMAEDKYTGGASFKPFLQHIRDHAVETLTADEKTALASVIKPAPPAPPSAAQPSPTAKPRTLVRNWQMSDLDPKLAALEHGRSFANGKAAYEVTGCAKCHIFKGEGGSVGPDITGVGARFSAHDFLESIILPSKAVSDQYAETKIVTRNNGAITGTIQSENADQIVIRTSPLSPATETIKTKDVVRRGLSKVSPMPEGLLNVLTEDEILDLIAYVRSAANPNDKAFKK